MGDIREREEARESIERAESLLARGNYAQALIESQQVLDRFRDRPPGDEAVFHMGLVYAHPGNPNRDYAKALTHFQNLLQNYPWSLWARRAAIWISVLEDHGRLVESLRKLEGENEKLSNALRSLKEEHEKLSAQFKKLKQVDIEIEERKREKER